VIISGSDAFRTRISPSAATAAALFTPISDCYLVIASIAEPTAFSLRNSTIRASAVAILQRGLSGITSALGE
jgi:hypothetical protein